MRTILSYILLCLHLSFCTSTDLDALLKLKAAMKGAKAKSHALDSWKYSPSPSAHCSFAGVTCDGDSRVTALNVTLVPLFGYLPPEIGLLDKLVSLTITQDNLTGPLPVELANLTSLRVLNISHNVFNDHFPGKIVLRMEQLEFLDAYDNNFSGPLPQEFMKLNKFKYLRLAGNYFSGEIPESYSEIQSLEFLGLNENGLTGKIPASLSKLKNLKHLYLGYSNAYAGGIPSELGYIKSLQLLDLASCTLTGEIPTSLSNLKNLDSLFLQINNLTGSIPPELSSLISLKSLDLSINELTGEIPLNFSELKNLTLINFFQNKLGGPVPEFIGDLPNLEVLQLWGNNFTLYLPENLGRNGKLKMLDVATNHFTGLIPRDLCKGGKLETLILMENFFFGPIPGELGDCKSLTKIRIGKNFLNESIPPGFFNLPSLTIMELNDNYFSGKLPWEISSNLLGILALSHNSFTGAIPPSVGNLKSLQTLSLDVNQFVGEIPSQVFDLRSLSKFNASANKLTGQIPASVTHCTSLTAFDLSQNMIAGDIPKGISSMKVLSILNLSRNHLTGPIPDEIRNMTSLTTLDLSYNNFVGKLPIGGQFIVFTDRSFAGNPNLCLSHNLSCPSPHKPLVSKSTKTIVMAIALATAMLLVLVTLYTMRKRKLQKSLSWKLTTFQRLDFKADDVLECLKEENIIGKGGAGIVYRGSMPDGMDVAIKRLVGPGSGRNDYGFKAEVQTLGRIRHRNIVRLLGYVSNKDTNLLLYEYMANGSLGEWLHGSKGGHLQWEARYRIAVEAAKGLCYLHHDCSPLIIHRDVKSNNILLDGDFEAHVADFGLAKFLYNPGASLSMSFIAGSYGYIAPEYAYTLKVDEKSDVYSFGVVLLELIAGKKPVGGEFGEGVDIVGWVKKKVSEVSQPSDAASVLAVVDPRLISYPLTSVIHMFIVAMQCVEENGTSRPTMREVVHTLTNPPHHNTTPNLINL